MHLQDHQCVPCLEAATKQAPVYPTNETAITLLDLTYIDIAGPIDPPTAAQNKYVAVFLDDATRMSSVYFLNDRSQFFNALTAYKALVENEQHNLMYRLRLDRAGENTSTAIIEMSLQHGMLLEYSPPHEIQSNGRPRGCIMIQELWKVARTMLLGSKLPLTLWAEAVSHANWIRNRLPSSRVDMEIHYLL